MTETYRFVDGKGVAHIKKSDDETYCGNDAGETLIRMEVVGVHQIGQIRGKDVCDVCRETVMND